MFNITEVNERTAKRYIEHIMKLGYMASYFETKYQKIIHPEQDDVLAHYLRKAEIVSWDEDKDVDIKQNSGIYALTFNDKTFYVGETVKTFATRLLQHKEALQSNSHYNGRLQKAYNDYMKKTDNKNLEPKIYLLEYRMCHEKCKGHFKLRNIMREYFYQELVLKAGMGLYNMEDTLRKFYTNWSFIDLPGISYVFSRICKKNPYYPNDYGVDGSYEDISSMQNYFHWHIQHFKDTQNADKELYKLICNALYEQANI